MVNNAGVFSCFYDAWAALRNVEWMLPVTAGSDAHDVWYLGSAVTGFPGRDAARPPTGARRGPDPRAGGVVVDRVEDAATRPHPDAQRAQVPSGVATTAARGLDGADSQPSTRRSPWTFMRIRSSAGWSEAAGEPVVLLHGLMGQMHHWDAVLDALGDGYRAIAPTLPVFHPDLREASVGALGRYVLRFLDALDIPRAVLGGNSLGGHVALRLALEHAERVSGLVLTGSSGLFERGFTSGVPHRPDRAWVRRKMEEVFFDPALVTGRLGRGRAPAGHARRPPRCGSCGWRGTRDATISRGGSGEIRVPTLLIWGSRIGSRRPRWRSASAP